MSERPHFTRPQFVRAMKDDGRLRNIAMNIAVAGARWSDDDVFLISPEYWGLFAPNYRIFGFDADPEGCKRTEAIFREKKLPFPVDILPMGLWSEPGVRTLHVTQVPSASSLFPPSEKFKRRIGGTEYLKVEKTLEIPVTTLDLVFPEQDQIIDFLQVDVQGADLAVLEGGVNLFARGILGVMVELVFTEIYTGQAMAWDVQKFLCDKGFQFHGFTFANADALRDIPVRNSRYCGLPTWANGIFLYNLIEHDPTFRRFSPHQFVKAAAIADLLGLHDVAVELLVHLTLRLPDHPEFNYGDFLYSFFRHGLKRPQEEVHSLPIIQKLRQHIRAQQIPAMPRPAREPVYLIDHSMKSTGNSTQPTNASANAPSNP